MSLLYRLYFALPNFAKFGFVGKVLNRLLGKVLKIIFDLTIPFYLDQNIADPGVGLNKEKRTETFIVSLTSFPTRIEDIWITIEIILRQSFKPDKVILWLAKDQFPDKKIPKRLLKLKERGLTIEFCDDDLRAHKKYFYSIQKYPNANIITLDDDLYYDKHVLRNVVELHKKYPNLIATNRAHKFTFENGKVKKYRKWKHNVVDAKPSHLLVPTGGAGTLYPPGALHEKAFDKKLIKKLCFHADDLWLKMMAYLNNTSVVTNNRYNKDFVTIASTQTEKLVSSNVLNGGNDQQLKNICRHFNVDLGQLANNESKENR